MRLLFIRFTNCGIQPLIIYVLFLIVDIRFIDGQIQNFYRERPTGYPNNSWKTDNNILVASSIVMNLI